MLFNLINIFENFRSTDIFDILIVSFILYKFFSILHGTRAIRVLVGLCAITILYWLSLSLEFYSLNWFLKHFFDYFFVIIIILFQEQLRSALANLGKTNFFKRDQEFYSTQIEEVIATCSALSKERTGALIVFERAHGLLNFSLTGTKLDSRIHSDILYSLFQPASPLHDGAVILFQDRIQAAGCFLPLSKNIDLDRHYGTRHRAAMGISEVSDAVVIVVSEESGQMNLCAHGKFYPCPNELALRKMLRSHLYSKNTQFQNDGVSI